MARYRSELRVFDNIFRALGLGRASHGVVARCWIIPKSSQQDLLVGVRKHHLPGGVRKHYLPCVFMTPPWGHVFLYVHSTQNRQNILKSINIQKPKNSRYIHKAKNKRYVFGQSTISIFCTF